MKNKQKQYVFHTQYTLCVYNNIQFVAEHIQFVYEKISLINFIKQICIYIMYKEEKKIQNI